MIIMILISPSKFNWVRSSLTHQTKNNVMKKLLLILFESLGFIVFIIIGFIAISLLDYFVGGLPLMIALLCVYIWLTRDNKDGFYRLFKDTHQSNLDDIERQELEEQEAEVIQ